MEKLKKYKEQPTLTESDFTDYYILENLRLELGFQANLQQELVTAANSGTALPNTVLFLENSKNYFKELKEKVQNNENLNQTPKKNLIEEIVLPLEADVFATTPIDKHIPMRQSLEMCKELVRNDENFDIINNKANPKLEKLSVAQIDNIINRLKPLQDSVDKFCIFEKPPQKPVKLPDIDANASESLSKKPAIAVPQENLISITTGSENLNNSLVENLQESRILNASGALYNDGALNEPTGFNSYDSIFFPDNAALHENSDLPEFDYGESPTDTDVDSDLSEYSSEDEKAPDLAHPDNADFLEDLYKMQNEETLKSEKAK